MLRFLFLPFSVKLINWVFLLVARLSPLFIVPSPPKGSPSGEKLLLLRLEHALYQIELLKFANRVLQQKLLEATQRPQFSLWEKCSLAFTTLLHPTCTDSLKGVFPVTWKTIKSWASSLKTGRLTALIPLSRRSQSFPKKTPDEIEALVCRMKRENPCWGYSRIAGELRKLGIRIHRSTVRRIIIRHGLAPPNLKAFFLWMKIITSKPHEMWAMDVFRIRLWGLIPIYICLILDDYSRMIVGVSVGLLPTAGWVITCFKEAIARYGHPLSLLTDNGSSFRRQFDLFASSEGIAHRRCSVGHPQTNGKIERLWKSLKTELLCRTLIVSKRYLTWLLKEYVLYYNSFRPHQGIQNSIPIEKLEERKTFIPLYRKGTKATKNQFAGGLLTSYVLKHAA